MNNTTLHHLVNVVDTLAAQGVVGPAALAVTCHLKAKALRARHDAERVFPWAQKGKYLARTSRMEAKLVRLLQNSGLKFYIYTDPRRWPLEIEAGGNRLKLGKELTTRKAEL